MSETRVRAATLPCKILLHYLVLLSEWDGMLDLWLKVLDIVDLSMSNGQGNSSINGFLVALPKCFVSKFVNSRNAYQEESVLESLKNIQLFMSSGSFL